MKHKPTTVCDRLGALWGLLTISDDDYTAYLRSCICRRRSTA